MPNERLPQVDSELVVWSQHLAGKLLTVGGEFGIDPQLAESYAAAQAAFAVAYTRASSHQTNSRVAVAEKNECKKSLLALSRRVAALARAQADVDPLALMTLGFHVRQHRSMPLPPPEEKLRLSLEEDLGTAKRIRLRGSGGGRGRPRGVAGALLFTYSGGPNPPLDFRDWRFALSTSSTVVTVELPPTLAPGTLVHIAGVWCNSRFEPGPLSAPLRTMISDRLYRVAA